MMQRCDRCGGSVVHFSSGETSCINCGKVVVEGRLPLVMTNVERPMAIFSRPGFMSVRRGFELDEDA